MLFAGVGIVAGNRLVWLGLEVGKKVRQGAQERSTTGDPEGD